MTLRSPAFVLAAAALGCSAPPAPVQDAGTPPAQDAGPLPTSYTGQPMLPPPAHGLQFNMGPFEVPAGGEVLMCQYGQMPPGPALEVVKYQVNMTGGSHHFVAVDSDVTAPPQAGMFDCSSQGEIFANAVGLALATQDQQDGITFPDGLAVHVPGGEVLLLQSHFFNLDPSGAAHTAYVTLNMETAVDPSAIVDHVGYIGFQNANIDVPAHGTQTISMDCIAQQPYRILGLAGHFHEHGTLFDVQQIPLGADAGSDVFQTTQWDHPQPAYFLPPSAPLAVNAGDDIRFSCSYDNTTDQPLYEGGSALTNEMCILFGYYYPSFWSSPLLCF